MALQRLASKAFRLGTGRKWADIRRSQRLRAVTAHYAEAGNLYPREAAITQLLGKHLADRAYLNLPAALRHNFGRGWQRENNRSCVKAIELTVRLLNSTEWHLASKRRMTLPYNTCVENVLPAQYDSWYRGPYPPNCLGVAQMLVGLARAHDIPHFLVEVVRTYDFDNYSAELLLIEGLVAIARIHAHQPGMEGVAERLAVFHERAVGHVLQASGMQAHYALAVRLPSGNWMVVDPYQRTYFKLDTFAPHDNFDCKGEIVNVQLDRTTAQSVSPLQSGLRSRLRAVQLMVRQTVDYFTAPPHDRPPFPWLIVQLKTLVAFCASPFATEASLRDICGQVDELPAIREAQRGFAYEDDTSPLAWQLILEAIRSSVGFTNRALRRQDRVHSYLQLVPPALGIGAVTLNHMRRFFPDRLGGILPCLIGTQWLLADALATQKGDRFTDLAAGHIARMTDTLCGRPTQQLVPPLHHLAFSRQGEAV